MYRDKFSKNDKAKLTKRIKKMSNLEKKNIEKISVNNNSVLILLKVLRSKKFYV